RASNAMPIRFSTIAPAARRSDAARGLNGSAHGFVALPLVAQTTLVDVHRGCAADAQLLAEQHVRRDHLRMAITAQAALERFRVEPGLRRILRELVGRR